VTSARRAQQDPCGDEGRRIAPRPPHLRDFFHAAEVEWSRGQATPWIASRQGENVTTERLRALTRHVDHPPQTIHRPCGMIGQRVCRAIRSVGGSREDDVVARSPVVHPDGASFERCQFGPVDT
jgi:hypothetical protein